MSTPDYDIIGHQMREVKEKTAEWLQTFPWSWWTTFTFRGNYSNASAWRAWERYINTLKKTSPGVGYFAALEYGLFGRDVPHLHALVLGVEEEYRKRCWAIWFERYGRAKILPYDSSQGAAHYIVKYVARATFDRGDWRIDIPKDRSISQTLWGDRGRTQKRQAG